MQRAAEFSAAHFFDRKGSNVPGRNRKMEQVSEIDRYEMKDSYKKMATGLAACTKSCRSSPSRRLLFSDKGGCNDGGSSGVYMVLLFVSFQEDASLTFSFTVQYISVVLYCSD